MKSGQRKRKPMSEETKRKIREGRLMTEKLKLVPEVRIERRSSSGYARQIRIAFTRYKGTRYIDLREWLPMKDGKFTDRVTGEWGPTRGGVTIRPLSILGSVIKALKGVHKVEERWIEKGWRTRTKDPEMIRIALQRFGDLEFVDVRTWAIEDSEYQPTRRGLVVTLDLLGQVIKGLEQFARPMRQVNPNYLRPRFVASPEPLPLLEAIYGDPDLPADQKIGTDEPGD